VNNSHLLIFRIKSSQPILWSIREGDDDKYLNGFPYLFSSKKRSFRLIMNSGINLRIVGENTIEHRWRKCEEHLPATLYSNMAIVMWFIILNLKLSFTPPFLLSHLSTKNTYIKGSNMKKLLTSTHRKLREVGNLK